MTKKSNRLIWASHVGATKPSDARKVGKIIKQYAKAKRKKK